MRGVYGYNLVKEWGEVNDDSVDSSTNKADEDKCCWVREISRFGSNFGVDDTLDSNFGGGSVAWYSGGDLIFCPILIFFF